MTARYEQQMSARARVSEAEEKERQEEEEYEDFLQQETERMKVRGFAPKVKQWSITWALSQVI